MEQINEIRNYINKIKATKFPIKGHCLAESEDFTKNKYIPMLCLLSNSNMSEDKVAYLNRLITGIDAEKSLDDYMRMSFEITSKVYDDFLQSILELKYAFLLDLLIISYMSDITSEQKELIVEVAESFSITKDEFAFLTGLCIRALKTDDADMFAKYIKHANYEDKHEIVNFEDIENANGNVVIIGETIVNAGEINTNNLPDTSVTFINCKFEGELYIRSDNKQVKILDCKFYKCTSNEYILFLYHSSLVKNCSFEACISVYNYYLNNSVIESCSFKDCSVTGSDHDIVLIEYFSQANNNVFEHCTSRRYGIYYGNGSSQSDNTFTNCRFPSGNIG